MNISKKYALASDILDHGEECEEKKEKTYDTMFLQSMMMMIIFNQIMISMQTMKYQRKNI